MRHLPESEPNRQCKSPAMIVSLHLPKAAGQTFRESLRRYFGDKLHTDYGDWIGDESVEAAIHRKERFNKISNKLSDILRDKLCIHGHFYASKWRYLIDNAFFFTIFRNPFESIPSAYEYILRNPQIPQPFVRKVHESKMTFSEFITHTGRDNLMSRLIAPLSIDDFAAIGLASEMPKTVTLFNQRFNTELCLPEKPINVNPKDSNYQLKPEEHRLIETYNPEDIDLWKQAVKRFSADTKNMS